MLDADTCPVKVLTGNKTCPHSLTWFLQAGGGNFKCGRCLLDNTWTNCCTSRIQHCSLPNSTRV